MKIVKKQKDKWILFNPDNNNWETIHHLIDEPDPNELEKPYVIFDAVGNSSAITFITSWSKDEALEKAVEDNNMNPELIYHIEEVKIAL